MGLLPEMAGRCGGKGEIGGGKRGRKDRGRTRRSDGDDENFENERFFLSFSFLCVFFLHMVNKENGALGTVWRMIAKNDNGQKRR